MGERQGSKEVTEECVDGLDEYQASRRQVTHHDNISWETLLGVLWSTGKININSFGEEREHSEKNEVGEQFSHQLSAGWRSIVLRSDEKLDIWGFPVVGGGRVSKPVPSAPNTSMSEL